MKVLSKHPKLISLLLLAAFCFGYSAEGFAYSSCQHQQNKNLRENKKSDHACCLKQKQSQARKRSCHTKNDYPLTENQTVVESTNPFETACYHCLTHSNQSSRLNLLVEQNSAQKKAEKSLSNTSFLIPRLQQAKPYESLPFKKPFPLFGGQDKHILLNTFLI